MSQLGVALFSLSNVRSSPLGAGHGVQVQEQLCRRALHTRADGRDAADHLVCEVREFLTEFSGGATPHRSGVAQS